MQFKETIDDMKKAILRVLLIICGLNVFTSCYGMPPGDWPEPAPLPNNQEQTKATVQTAEDSEPEETDRIDIINPSEDLCSSERG